MTGLLGWQIQFCAADEVPFNAPLGRLLTHAIPRLFVGDCYYSRRSGGSIVGNAVWQKEEVEEGYRGKDDGPGLEIDTVIFYLFFKFFEYQLDVLCFLLLPVWLTAGLPRDRVLYRCGFGLWRDASETLLNINNYIRLLLCCSYCPALNYRE